MSARVALAAVTIALALPATASAETICVPPQTGCDSSAADPQMALDAAALNPGPDVVRLGAATYSTPGGYAYNAAADNPVEIDGMSTSATKLQVAVNTDTALTVTGGASATVKRMTIDAPFTAPGSHPTGLRLSGSADVVDGVVITGAQGMRGIVEGDTGGLTVTNSKIMLDIGTSDLAVTFLNGTGRIADSDLSAHLGVDVTGSNVTVERISLFSSVRGIRVNPSGIKGSTLHLSSSILLPLGGSPALRVEGTFGSQPVSADVHHVTIAGGSSDTGASVASTASDASLALDSSIIRLGVPIARDQQGSTADNVSADYSDISTGSTNSGSGSITMGAHNVDVDPQFVSATDYQLKPTSPVIDIGNPAIDPMESPTDFAFFPRLVAGHGGCTPVSDMGAYEFQHHEPTAAATVTPTTATAGTAVTFDASGSCDSTPGAPLSYSWTFDDGGTGTGVTVAHTFASAGPHTGTVTVSDTGATTSKATATVQVNAAPVTNPPPPDTPDFLGATLKGSRTLKVDKKGRFSWRFACPTGSPATCHEVVRLTADKRTVASARFNVLAGKTKTVHSKLSKRARKTLRRKKELTARATITSTGDPGDVKVGHATVKLKL